MKNKNEENTRTLEQL